LPPDSKTFPDKPTRYGLNQTVTAWQALRESGGNVTYSELETFLNDYFVRIARGLRSRLSGLHIY
jgi:hypothetical protein